MRYGAPVIVLDLVKQAEKKPRESLIGECLKQAVQAINGHIEEDKKIRYCALDFSRVSKSISGSGTASVPVAADSSSLPQTPEPPRSSRRRGTGIAGPEWAAFENNINLRYC